MLKSVIILFLVIYPLYVLFTRTPDFFDGEFYAGTIEKIKDSAGHQKMNAIYTIAHHNYTVDADYLFRSFKEGERVPLIYETAMPAKASLYRVWGYWIRWQELLSFLCMFIFFYFLAENITGNPTPESLLEQLEGSKPKPRKPRYD